MGIVGEHLRRRKQAEERLGVPVCARCARYPTAPGYSVCQRCLDYVRMDRRQLREIGICTRCRRNPREEGGGERCAECRVRTVELTKAANARARLRFVALYGGCCACCGEADARFLTLDHVNNDGASEKGPGGRRRNSIQLIKRLVRQREIDPRFQVLCFNCNCARAIYGDCPHQSDPELHVSETLENFVKTRIRKKVFKWTEAMIGSNNHRAKLTAVEVREIRLRYAQGNTTHERLGKEFGVDGGTIRDIVIRRNWNHTDLDIPPIAFEFLPKTHCRNGHPFEGENLYIDPKRGTKNCQECRRAAEHRYRDRKRGKAS